MHIPAISCSVCLVACASGSGEGSYTSVRERLGAELTQLSIAPAVDIGTLDARRWSQAEGWVSGTAPVVSNGGSLGLELDRAGSLDVQSFELAIDAIELPSTLTGKPLGLRDVRVRGDGPPAGITWTSDDDGAAQFPITLTLSWSVATDGQMFPLADQKLEAISMDVSLSGSAEQVEASIGLRAEGSLWSWAEVLELSKVDLAMAATSD